jgi:crotonobetainyl-CoA:carnitine CoA-transferase CaiB-like acyl-CoA transferase
MFARMGAEVIKIEALTGDESRKNSPRVRGQSAYWVQYNSGKKSLAIDLRTAEGKEVLRDLVKVSDFFLQNFRPGTISRMDFDYETLKNLNRGIIMINVSAYGQDGPYADRVGFDPIGQALGGMMMTNGLPGGPPARTNFPLIDRITALHGTIGALAALRERDISGEGQEIDVSLADTGITVNEIPISAYLGDGQEFEREGNGAGLSNTYQTRDGWAFIAATNRAMFERLCAALGKPEWVEDPRFTTRQDRRENAEALETELRDWFERRTTIDAVDELSKHSVPCAPVNDTAAAAMDPLITEREAMVEVPDPVAGTMWVTGKMIKFSRTPMQVGSAPVVGEHTDEILTGLLGYDAERVAALKAAGAVAGSG